MTETPDPSLFEKVEFPDTFVVSIRMELFLRREVKASCRFDAKETAMREIEAELEYGIDVCDYHGPDFDIDHLYPKPPMYRVLRDGLAMQDSILEPGDQPRAADDRGF
jgi:hypothetical protein